MKDATTRAREGLRHVITTLPIPAAPPRYASLGAAVGVTLLDAALSLDHISRVDESLTVVDRAHLSRKVRIHLSLDRLTQEQYSAGLRYSRLRERVPATVLPDQPERAPLLWVPVTRLSRSVVAPVVLTDAEGRETPRATQPELLPLLNAALYRLLALVLESAPEASDQGSALYELLHKTNQARWLLQNAITRLVYEEGAAAFSYEMPDLEVTRESARQLALAVVEGHLGGKQEPFLELLAHVSEEYIVLAGVDSSKREHYLEYQPPILPALSRSPVRSGVRRLGRSLAPTGREFVIRYSTPLPRTLDSYHVTVEADEEIRIREAMLTTDHAGPDVRRLRSDIDELARMAKADVTPVNTKFYEYELQDAYGRLSDLILARASDLRRYEQYLQWRGASNARSAQRPSGGYRGGSRATTRSRLETLVRLAVRFNRGELTQLVGSHEASADRLAWLSASLRHCEFERDVVSEDDPREHAAHMYWRPRHPPLGASLPHPSEATLSVVFADDPPALVASVMRTTVALATLVFALGTVLFGGLGWLEWSSHPSLSGDFQSDAVIALLLIAPALLLNRLNLPRSNTLVGQLRLLPRALAISAVAITGAVGVAIAGSKEDRTLQLAFLVGFVLLTIIAVMIGTEMLASWLKRRRSRDPVCQAPRWLYDARGIRPTRRHPDAEFAVTRGV